MGQIGYGYGSQWHLLRYLGYHRQFLSNQVLKATGGDTMQWLDFHFSSLNQSLYDDMEQYGLDFIEEKIAQSEWRQFWPQTGQAHNWDAIGKISVNGSIEWVLTEAKSNIGEINSFCKAKGHGREIIKLALQQTQRAFQAEHTPLEQWLERYYQYCNRLAMLHFLTNVCSPSIPARLVFIYFTGDNTPNAVCPQKEEEWYNVLAALYDHIGINLSSMLMSRVHTLYIPVHPNALGQRKLTPIRK